MMKNSSGTIDDLSRFLKSKIDFSDAELSLILSNFNAIVIEKNRFLLRKGQIVNSYYFVCSGGLRIYLDTKDQQITGWLAFKNDFFTELSSIKTGRPTQFNIQAIENSVVLAIDKSKMEILYERLPRWQKFGRHIWEDAFLRVITAILDYQTMSAEERYFKMMSQSDLLQKVPLKQLATYLGITQTSLSRLRRKLSKPKDK